MEIFNFNEQKPQNLCAGFKEIANGNILMPPKRVCMCVI